MFEKSQEINTTIQKFCQRDCENLIIWKINSFAQPGILHAGSSQYFSFLEEKLYVCGFFFKVYTPVCYDVFLFWVLFPQKRVPHFKTMFSDLRHYPRYSIHLEVTDPVPKFIPRQWRGYAEQNREALIRYTT